MKLSQHRNTQSDFALNLHFMYYIIPNKQVGLQQKNWVYAEKTNSRPGLFQRKDFFLIWEVQCFNQKRILEYKYINTKSIQKNNHQCHNTFNFKTIEYIDSAQTLQLTINQPTLFSKSFFSYCHLLSLLYSIFLNKQLCLSPILLSKQYLLLRSCFIIPCFCISHQWCLSLSISITN